MLIIELIGEGRTDIGLVRGGIDATPVKPEKGVLTVLLHRLCERPTSMWIIRRRYPSLIKKNSRAEKVKFAKIQAYENRHAGLVFVIDTEEDDLDKKRAELEAGRDMVNNGLPTVIGVAHRCIEAWLLSDPAAIARGMSLATIPACHPHPETLPAPNMNKSYNPKTELSRAAGVDRKVNSAEATKIALEISDLNAIEAACPLGFGPFAVEVRTHILPLFYDDVTPGE